VYLYVARPDNVWKLYVNGELVLSGGWTAALNGFSDSYQMNNYYDLELGGLRNNSGTVSNTYRGLISSVAIYDGAEIPADRVLAHYNSISSI
jgi:hypothetical protein